MLDEEYEKKLISYCNLLNKMETLFYSCAIV